uniref:Endonuclease/exonuclease/phosphatase domain-containing protein n=1 Tax=Rhodnius prolixus TaxID=13249 RepID=T1HTY2_RHOPR
MLEEQLKNYKVEVVALQEIRWREADLVELGDYVLINSGHRPNILGTSFMIKNTLKHAVISYKAVSELDLENWLREHTFVDKVLACLLDVCFSFQEYDQNFHPLMPSPLSSAKTILDLSHILFLTAYLTLEHKKFWTYKLCKFKCIVRNIPDGMGGQIGFWGVWLDVNFGKGRCETFCSTFKNYHCPSKFSDFTFEILEAWAVDEVAVSKIGTGTILEKDPAAKALLEMTKMKN